MAHTRIRLTRNAHLSISLILCLSGAATMLGSRAVPVSSAYNNDATRQITRLQMHSSFHYELVRVLAVMAGFSKDEAEQIAVAGEAVDLGTFTGYKLSNGAQTLTITRTNRFGPNGLFYHFGRRSNIYQMAQGVPGAKTNTCDYFTNGDPSDPKTAPCTTAGPELDQIRNWAFNQDGPKPTSSQLPKDGKGNYIQPRTLTALGIYLHAIADTYSHEQCMISEQYRFHMNSPAECNANWHVNYPVGDFGTAAPQGIPFANSAAYEVWRALQQYRDGRQSSDPPGFATDFINTSDACTRVQMAVNKFNSLTGDNTTKIICPSPKPSRRRSTT